MGEYAAALRAKLRSFARVQVVGELVNLSPSRARVYFELRDAARRAALRGVARRLGAMLASRRHAPSEGCRSSSPGLRLLPRQRHLLPGFTFAVTDLRVAGEGDLLARIDRLRKQLDAEGLLEPQKRLPCPSLPRTIGVITGEQGKARDDVLAALARRGWAGRLVWAFAPVQDRHAAPAIVRALGDLAALAQVDVVIVARGGGSLADLLCFCDETLCRTVALLNVPVIASVGHHTDRTLLDDVAAVSCSTPTHAAEAAVAVDCREARAAQPSGARLRARAGWARHGARRACATRAAPCCARAPRAPAPAHIAPRARAAAPAAARDPRAERAGALGASEREPRRRWCRAQGRGGAAGLPQRRPRELHGSRWRSRRTTRSARWSGLRARGVARRPAADDRGRARGAPRSCACASPTARRAGCASE